MRVGNMEVDVLAAYGVSFIMHESLVTLADPWLVVLLPRVRLDVCGRGGMQEFLLRVQKVRYCGQGPDDPSPKTSAVLRGDAGRANFFRPGDNPGTMISLCLNFFCCLV